MAKNKKNQTNSAPVVEETKVVDTPAEESVDDITKGLLDLVNELTSKPDEPINPPAGESTLEQMTELILTPAPTDLSELAPTPEPTPTPVPVPTPEPTPEPAQTKNEKRSLSWTEATELIPTAFASVKENGKADLTAKLKGLLGAARETFSIPGYNDGPKTTFNQKFNLHWDVAEKQLESKRASVGRVITFSLGPNYNHFIVVVPVDKVEVKQRDGSVVEVTRANTLDNVQAGTNHGRTYKKARHIAQAVGLAHKGLEPGKYCLSNEDNFNLFQDIQGAWKIYTKKGNPKTLGMEPEELLADIINGGDKWKVING